MKKRLLVVASSCFVVLLACEGGKKDPAARPLTGGNAERGELVIHQKGCGACHEIPGIRGANGTVAAPLAKFSQRSFIAGELPNNPDNLVRWIKDPPAVHSKVAMPNLYVTDPEARDIAAYLYTLD